MYFPSEQPSQQVRKSGLLWILVLFIPLSLSIALITRYTIHRGRRRETKTKIPEIADENEGVQMFSVPLSGQTIEDTRSIFLKQLKGKYADLYNAVQPIPYIRDRLFCVDRVFVEGGLEVLVSGNAAVSGRTWETLNYYHDVLSNPRLKSSRKILEGEPGYGKSTLTLQYAYDWCNRTSISPLKDVEILILLRLRQFGGVKSIFRAIRQFILPRDSLLTETDIENIISSTPSTMIILDGYDEYPDKDDMESDLNRIIARQMFQDLEVILTTRSSCLPRIYSAQTNRVRLTGFDGKARDLYVKKAVVGNDSVAAVKILQGLQESSLLADLCQVPLLFVMYAHMSHESNDTLCFNSVTSFFRHMIACFHSHMLNKMEDDNVQKYKLFEKKHEKLDNLAFEGLTGKNQKIVWPKKQIRKRIGEDFYDQYIRTGILIEEGVLDITYFSDSKENELGYCKTEVRFYHKLFGEWYAAHTLAERCKYLPVWMLTKLLRNVDPFDLQYFYRFACGLSPKAAEKIIKHLRKRDGGDKFTVLCILEKTGDMDSISDTIRELCSKEIKIREDDTTLLQRSTIQLLEIASGNQISISHVYLNNCYSTVDLRGGNHLQLKSNLSIPVLSTLNRLDILEQGREITSEEFTGILQYSSKCLALKELRFFHCLLPPTVKAESVSVLRSRNVEVFWYPRGDSYPVYQLNLQSCLWEVSVLLYKSFT
ncbi:NLR family CARD domain-containing protein 4 [Holothuria leucospilota]|uniref:NLR family CARD domain-containing protein 4 n=1 Tax=Holothuria leucospilota TaxID=206669 RepID=A0A9Q1BSJ8_HOLLE|nr:NLR family CARD domain-containing protein 4 [Holothuria leucospilota]